MVILEEETPCIVTMVTKSMLKTPLLLAMRVKKRLKKKQVTYLATLREEKLMDTIGEPMLRQSRESLMSSRK